MNKLLISGLILLTATIAQAQNVRVTNPNTAPANVADAPGFAAAITPNDSADLPTAATRGIYVGTTGDIVVDLVGGGTSITFKAVPIGILRVAIKRVRATNTTASNLVALY